MTLSLRSEYCRYILLLFDSRRWREADLTLLGDQDEQFATHASAILALANILSALDELEETTKELVGEVSMPGYHDLLARRAEV